MFFNQFRLGIFLGFSILQLLEYGVAVIITPINSLHNYLRSKIAGLVPVKQLEQQQDRDSEYDVVNSTNHQQEIRLDQESTWNSCADLREEMKKIKQELRELKTKSDGYVSGVFQRKEIFLNGHNQSKHIVTIKRSKIPIRIPKHDP